MTQTIHPLPKGTKVNYVVVGNRTATAYVREWLPYPAAWRPQSTGYYYLYDENGRQVYPGGTWDDLVTRAADSPSSHDLW